MKLLVIGIDALMPELVFENPELCPNITNLLKKGSGGSYSGYIYGHGSRDNWITMYTGKTPEEHGTIINKFQKTNKYPRTFDYSDENTLWNLLSTNNVKVGFWKGLSTTPPEEVNGYMVAGEPHYEKDGYDAEIVSREAVVVENKKYLLKYIEGSEPKHPEPRAVEDYGYTFEALKKNPQIIDEIMEEDYFAQSLDFLKENLDFRLKNIISVNKHEPVDLLWVYEAVFDYIAHFQAFDPKHKILKEALVIIDKYVGDLINALKPENVLLISDHGQKSYREIFPNASAELVKEVFGLAEQSIITDKNIVLIGRIGGLVTGLHSLKGVVIFAGQDFKNCVNNDMRTIDLYPLILELFNCKVPEGRIGYIHDIFSDEHQLVNKDKLFPKIEKKNVLLIQTEEISEFNRVINEFYKANRFTNIYIYGEQKYRDVLLANDQVEGFYPFDCPKENINVSNYYVSCHNRKTKEINFIEVTL